MVQVTIRHYKVLKFPVEGDFEGYVLTQLKERKYLEVDATLIPDELSLKRENRSEVVKFAFRILVLHNSPDFSVEVQDVATGKWSHIITSGDMISFKVVD